MGAELAAALKNVIAIAAGIVDGLGYGQNTQAALITRGLAEIARLAVALGGSPETLSGLAGLGDLVLTCTGGFRATAGSGRPWARARPWTRRGARPRWWPRACAPPWPPAPSPSGRDRHAHRRADARGALRGKAPRAAVDALMMRSLKRE